MGHSARGCILGMRIAAELRIPLAEQADLYYTLLLKDAGCSSNASRLFHILNADEIRAKRDVKTTDWTRIGWESLQYAIGHVAVGKPFLHRVRTLLTAAARQKAHSSELIKIRCERGAAIARRMGFAEPVAAGIHSLDEHWDGAGYPDHLRGQAIPLFSRIANLVQTLEVFYRAGGPDRAIDIARHRSRTWFDPQVVDAAVSLANRQALWQDCDSPKLLDLVLAMEPEERRLKANDETIESICDAFADVIDAKSPFTYRHSTGVGSAAVAIAHGLGLRHPQVTLIRRAALLHDIGKLSVSNAILEKPASLDASEWEIIKKHPYYSWEILRRIPGFHELSEIAALHHERLDGSGYYRGVDGSALSLPARIVAVADVFDALAAKRPYRDPLPIEKVFAIMQAEARTALDPQCIEVLMAAAASPDGLTSSLSSLAASLGSSR